MANHCWPCIALALSCLWAAAVVAQPRGAERIIPLSNIPVCNGTQGDVLPAGLKGCSIAVSVPPMQLPRSAYYSFRLDSTSADMTINIRLRTVNGVAGLFLYRPNDAMTAPPEIVGSNMFASEGYHFESAIFLTPTDPRSWQVGTYVIQVQVQERSPAMTLTVTTTPNTVVLHPYEQQKMSELFGQCCTAPDPTANTEFCTSTAALATRANHTWQQDLCHQPYNECDDTGKLVRLMLPGAGLACAAFPPALGELRQLRVLDLSENTVADTAANAVAVLTKNGAPLEELYLYGVGLSGPLDCGLLASPVQRADLRANRLTGTLPPCIYTGTLTELHVGANALGGPLPDVPPGRNNLTALFAGDQTVGFTGAIPASLLAQPTLEYLDLSNSKLAEGFGGRISDSIVFLLAQGNTMRGALPNIPASAVVIDLSNNQLTGELPDLEVASELTFFYASSGNSFSGGLAGLPASLQGLSLSDNQLSGPLPELPPNLVVLDIGGNSFSGDISRVNFTIMQVFSAPGQDFRGSTLNETIGGAFVLRLLNLSSTGLTGALPQEWAPRPGVFTDRPLFIDLSNNALAGPVPGPLAQLPRLFSLNLTRNQLSGNLAAFASALGNRSNLIELQLDSNQLTGALPAGLQDLGVFAQRMLLGQVGQVGGSAILEPLPRVLYLQNNRLGGPFPMFLITEEPNAVVVCRCNITIGLDTTFTCPPLTNITDPQWFYQSSQGFACTDPARQAVVPVTNFLRSPSFQPTNIVLPAPGAANELGSGFAVPSSGGGSSGGLGAGAIAGIAVAAAVVALLAAALLAWAVRRKRLYGSGRRSFRHYHEEQPASLNGHAATTSSLPLSKSLSAKQDIELGPNNQPVL